MYGRESWTITKAEGQRIDAFKLWCWRRLLSVPWTARRSDQSILNQPWTLIGRTDAKVAVPKLWLPDAKSWVIGKDPDPGKDQRQKEKGMTEDEMVGWHHQLNGHEFEQIPWDSEGLACCSSWSCNESHMTYWLNNNKNNTKIIKA